MLSPYGLVTQASKSFRSSRIESELPWCVEPLERRQMLAGDVTAVLTGTGTLRITGSNDSNQIQIGSDGAGNTKITGASGTTVNGVTSKTFFEIDFDEIPQDIVINMRGGDDLVEIDTVNIARNLRVNMGAGDDTFGFYDTTVQQDATIRLGSGEDFCASSRTDILDDLRIVGGSGTDVIGFSECLTVIDRTVVNSGAGGDVLFLQGEFRGTTVVATGAGSDTVTANQMRVDAEFKLRTGGDSDQVLIGNIWVTNFGGTVSASGGAGDDGLVQHPTGPTVDDRGFETLVTDAAVNNSIDTFGVFLQTAYGIRGGDVTQLGCP